MNELNTDIVIALMDKAKADKEAEFTKELQDQVNAAKTEAEARVKEEYEPKVTELNSKLENVSKELEEVKASLQEEKAEKEKIQNEFDGFKNQIEQDKVFATRESALKAGNIELPNTDEAKAFILKMTDTEFDIFVNAKATKKEEDAADNKADAGLEVADKDKQIEVEDKDIIGKVLKNL